MNLMSRTRFRSRKQITRLIKAIPTYLVILINIQTGSDFFNRNIYYWIRVKQARFSQKRHLTYLCRTILILAALLGETCEQLFARFLFKPEFINRFCWFSMTHMGNRWVTKYPNLNKIGQKLRLWECRRRKVQNVRFDVIKLRSQQFEKN